MKVLYITPWYPHEKNPVTGVYVRDIAAAAALFCNVMIIHSFNESTHFFQVYEEMNNELRVIHLISPRFKILILDSFFSLSLLGFVLVKIIKKNKPDILHVHVTKMGFIPLIIGKLFHIPLIITEHAKLVDDYNGESINSLFNHIKIISSKYILNHADTLIVSSHSIQNYLQGLGVTTRFDIIPNIVDTSLFYPIDIPNNSTKKKILFVGALNPVKGLDYLIEAINIIHKEREDFILDVIGDGKKRQDYEKIVTQLNLSNFIIFHGQLEKQDAAGFIRNCDFFVLPSIYETFGIVLIEAMACGKPVITTGTGGQCEFVNSDNGILVPPRNSEKLAESILLMLNNYERYQKKEISQNITEKYNSHTVGKLLLQSYLTTIARFMENNS